MKLEYEKKKTLKDILGVTNKSELISVSGINSKNKLIHGDNFLVLRTLLEDYNLAGEIDLVYIDPPFSTNGSFKMSAGRANTVSMSTDDEIAYTDTLVGADFLEYLRERLVLIRELMSEKASIYLHIDYKIGHYVKIIMDEIFGRNNFRNDITRIKCNPKNFGRKGFGNIKDLLLFYSKTKNYTWNDQRTPFTNEEINKLFKKSDHQGRKYTTIPLHAPGETSNGNTGKEWKGIKPPKGRHWRSAPSVLDELEKKGLIEWSATGVPRKKIFADEAQGKKVQDIWEFKDPQYPSYPTEKNLNLLEFIINSSSSSGDLVMDAFCGSGTALIAAQNLGRSWIGIDKSAQAIKIAQKRLAEIQGTLFSVTEYEFLKQKP